VGTSDVDISIVFDYPEKSTMQRMFWGCSPEGAFADIQFSGAWTSSLFKLKKFKQRWRKELQRDVHVVTVVDKRSRESFHFGNWAFNRSFRFLEPG